MSVDIIERLQRAVLLDTSVDIENSTPSVGYTLSDQKSLQKHINRHGFGPFSFVDELGVVAELESLLEHGEEHKNMLYTFRSCARALPQVTKQNEEHKVAIYQASWDVLRSGMEKIKDLMDFQYVVVQKFVKETKRLSSTLQLHTSGSEMLLNRLVQLLDLIAVLDHLKDCKTSIKDDFNCYKRTFHSVQNSLENNGNMIRAEMDKIQLFLSDPRHPRRYIFYSLKNALPIECEMVIIRLINYCQHRIEQNRDLLPEEKCRPHRVLPVLMNLLDGLGASTSVLDVQRRDDTGGGNSTKEEIRDINVFKHKLIDVSRLSKMLRLRPIVPLYMDMHVTIPVLLQDCPHYDRDNQAMRRQWSGEEYDGTDALFHSQYSLENEERWGGYRNDHSQYMVELQQVLNQVTKASMLPPHGTPDLTPTDRERCMQILLRGFHLLSNLTTSIRFQSAWKAGHAADVRTTIDRDTSELLDPTTPGIEYALASVENHTRSEMKVLVDVLSMIKSLASLLRRAEGMLAPVIRAHIHRTTQLFVQHTVLCLLYKAHKHKRKEETEHLLQMRSLCADWCTEIEPFEDYKSRAKVTEVRDSYEKGSSSSTTSSSSNERIAAEERAERVAPVPVRSVAPSSSQLRLLRSMVFCLYDDRAPWYKEGGMFSSGTFTKRDMTVMMDYYDRSEYFSYALNASSVVVECSDVSSLWYREFYLEMTKQVQFPISMSMPWRLAEHVIRSPQNNMLENMLYAMDIYNDAARMALDVLRQRHIYDEIEAEVNLVFDQLIYLLNEEVYGYCKDVAAGFCMDDRFVSTLEEIHRSKDRKHQVVARELLEQFRRVGQERYSSVVRQRHVQLLGRSVDLRTLMVERLNASLRLDIEQAISRFESTDLTGICELQQTLSILRETRDRLSHMLDDGGGDVGRSKGGLSSTSLDDYDMILSEMNESVSSPEGSTGRIGRHVLIELVRDVYPNWLYNEVTRRFIKPSNGSMRRDEHEKRRKERRRITKSNKSPFGRRYGRAYDSVFRLYREYVGREHCDSMVCMLEETGDLYLVLDELLVLQKMLVLEEIAPYVEQLQIGLRPMKLPPYQLRAGGSYLAIQLALKPIMGYEDLKSQVFQNFRETGNALAFLHLLDATMTHSNCFEFVATSSFFGVSPSTFEEEEERNERNEEEERGTTSSTTTSSSSTSSSIPFLNLMRTATDNMPKEGGATILNMAESSVRTYGIDECHVTSEGGREYATRTRDPLLTSALLKMKEAVDESMCDTRRGEEEEEEEEIGGGGGGGDTSPYLWDDFSEPTNGVIDIETTKAFHRIYSAMSFMFCEPSEALPLEEEGKGEEEQPPLPPPIDDHREFGDGMAWCGIALIHLLRQRPRYELLDFASHVLSVSEWEGMHDTSMVGSVDQQTLSTLKNFLANARESKMQASRLFELFQSHYEHEEEEEMIIHHPPDREMLKSLGFA